MKSAGHSHSTIALGHIAQGSGAWFAAMRMRNTVANTPVTAGAASTL